MNSDLSGHHRIRSSEQFTNVSSQWGQKHLCLYTVLCVFVVGCFLTDPGLVWSAVSWSRTSIRLQARELRQVHVVFRHGARTPLHDDYYNSLPWDECADEYEGVQLAVEDVKGGPSPPAFIDQNARKLPGGCKEGQLTAPGYQMALDLGRELRSRYIISETFLTEEYKASEVWLWTTRFTRTVQTLRGVLTGLYPSAVGKVKFTAGSTSEAEEIMYGKPVNCPALAEQTKMLLQLINVTASNNTELSANAADVSARLKLPTAPNVYWTYLFDVLAAMRAVGKTPKELDNKTWDTINAAASWFERSQRAPCDSSLPLPNNTCTQVVSRSVGRLINKITSRLRATNESVCQGDSSKNCSARLYLYSGHDSTITPLLAALGLDDTLWPPYASSVVVELWRLAGAALDGGSSGWEVRLLYHFDPMAVMGAREDGYVPLSDFLTQVKRFELDEQDYKSSCQAPSSNNSRKL